MKTLTELIVRVADLVEAEGRVLRIMTIRVALGVAIITVAAGASLAGIRLMLGAIYILAAERCGTAGGAAIAGALALAIGGALAWLGRQMGS